MTSESYKILEFHQYQKSDKASFIIYADLESMIEKSIVYKNDSEKSSTRKVSIRLSMSTISSFKDIENKYDIGLDGKSVQSHVHGPAHTVLKHKCGISHA